jgi:uncharacterized protein YoxC
MASDVTREEHQQLVGRVDVLEREVDGEKLVTRHILQQTRRNSDDLAAIKTRLDRVEVKVDGVAEEVRSLKTSFHDLVRNLPKLLSDAVRDALPKR